MEIEKGDEMLTLIKIEWMKISKWKMLLIWLVAVLVVAGLTGLIIFGLVKDNKLSSFVGQSGARLQVLKGRWSGWEIASSMFALLFSRVIFLIFEAYLISKLLIEEFKRRTILQLFSYPFSKLKIIWAKIIVIVLISFFAQCLAQIILQMIIKLATVFVGIEYSLNFNFLTIFGVIVVGLLPLIFGMIRYSIVVTMLGAVFLAAGLSNLGNMMANVIFLLTVSLVSLLVVAMSAYYISKKDVKIY